MHVQHAVADPEVDGGFGEVVEDVPGHLEVADEDVAFDRCSGRDLGRMDLPQIGVEVGSAPRVRETPARRRRCRADSRGHGWRAASGSGPSHPTPTPAATRLGVARWSPDRTTHAHRRVRCAARSATGRGRRDGRSSAARRSGPAPSPTPSTTRPTPATIPVGPGDPVDHRRVVAGGDEHPVVIGATEPQPGQVGRPGDLRRYEGGDQRDADPHVPAGPAGQLRRGPHVVRQFGDVVVLIGGGEQADLVAVQRARHAGVARGVRGWQLLGEPGAELSDGEDLLEHQRVVLEHGDGRDRGVGRLERSGGDDVGARGPADVHDADRPGEELGGDRVARVRDHQPADGRGHNLAEHAEASDDGGRLGDRQVDVQVPAVGDRPGGADPGGVGERAVRRHEQVEVVAGQVRCQRDRERGAGRRGRGATGANLDHVTGIRIWAGSPVSGSDTAGR